MKIKNYFVAILCSFVVVSSLSSVAQAKDIEIAEVQEVQSIQEIDESFDNPETDIETYGTGFFKKRDFFLSETGWQEIATYSWLAAYQDFSIKNSSTSGNISFVISNNHPDSFYGHKTYFSGTLSPSFTFEKFNWTFGQGFFAQDLSLYVKAATGTPSGLYSITVGGTAHWK